jgi:sec-independent protein translocase protein TatA
MPGTPELIIIAIVLLLIFGGAKLPKLARSLGSAKSEFEKGAREGSKDEDETKA